MAGPGLAGFGNRPGGRGYRDWNLSGSVRTAVPFRHGRTCSPLSCLNGLAGPGVGYGGRRPTRRGGHGGSPPDASSFPAIVLWLPVVTPDFVPGSRLSGTAGRPAFQDPEQSGCTRGRGRQLVDIEADREVSLESRGKPASRPERFHTDGNRPVPARRCGKPTVCQSLTWRTDGTNVHLTPELERVSRARASGGMLHTSARSFRRLRLLKEREDRKRSSSQ